MCVCTDGQRQSSDTLGGVPPEKVEGKGQTGVAEACMRLSWAHSCVWVSGGPPLPRPLCVHRCTSPAPAGGPDLQTSLSHSAAQASGPHGELCELGSHPAYTLFFRTHEGGFLHSFTVSSIHLFTNDLWGPVVGPTPQGPGDGAGSCADGLRLWGPGSEVGAPGKPGSPQERGSGTHRQ